MIDERLKEQMADAMAFLPNGTVKTALQALFKHYGVSQSKIAKRISIDGGTLSRRLDKLKGLSERDQERIYQILEAVAEISATPPRSPKDVAERFIGELEEANTLESPTTPRDIAVMNIAQMLDNLTDSDIKLVERMVERLQEHGNGS
ncbi:hypothetical protein [Collinsella aerofaciens]|uniref:Uncharacterized protein n=1 Tax=Collinsella aerofaciens TaxID=74426 RepID=A0A5K1IWA9_9ACTN|nr:hypothetical protein [Collinsella aerofaciens]VWL93060.1 Uncharacterised protein [Collinsella aerofaciens]